MKGSIAFIILIVATAISTLLFRNKFSTHSSQVDQLKKGLVTVKKLTPLSATIYYDTAHIDGELFSVARYVLAPRNLIIINSTADVDTVLSISRDSTISNTHIYNKIILNNKSDNLYYTLSVSDE